MRIRILIVLLAALILSLPLWAAGPHKFVGSDKCKICHNTAKQGKQYTIWQSSAHARAFATLASEEALKIGQQMGIENPQQSDKCLSCHVTAFGVADSLKEATLTMAEGVGCEACHGPGSDYKQMSIMKDREKSMAAGLLMPDEKTCLGCHNDKSPTYKPFNFEERAKQIAHPVPKAEDKG